MILLLFIYFILFYFIFLVYWGSAVDGLLVYVLGSIRLTLLLSRVIRFNCLVSDFVTGVVVL